jgi:DEAD/DEAH box helicase domain-containing protein
MRKITLDIETTGAAGGFMDTSQMELSLIGIHDSATDEYSSYVKEELPRLWPLLESADVLVGYNSDHFDIPILNKYYAGDLAKIKSIDLLSAIKDSLGRRLKLDSVAQATLGRGKIGHGLDAVKWWAEGEIEKVRKYCLDDVKLTKEVYEFALKNGFLWYSDFGEKRKIPLDTSAWETGARASLTHTLPF